MAREHDPWTPDYLRHGDVLLLEWGTPVIWHDCPRNVTEFSGPYSEGTVEKLIKIGVPIERPTKLEKTRKMLTQLLNDFFLSASIGLDDNIRDRFVKHTIPPNPNEKSYLIPAGLYVIVEMENERYNRGQRVTCKTFKPDINRTEYTISFYQGGYHPSTLDKVKVVQDADDAFKS
jgi:hypothetical protein